MRTSANIKRKKFSPIPLPDIGNSFKLDGMNFKVTNVSTNEVNGEHTAQCEIETPGCQIIIIMKAGKPFKKEEIDG